MIRPATRFLQMAVLKHIGCLDKVRHSCGAVCSSSRHVSIDQQGINNVIQTFSRATLDNLTSANAFDAETHLVGRGALTAQYLLVLDALNFCFWPEEDLEYGDLARGLKEAVSANSDSISAANLRAIDEQGIQKLTQCPKLPMLSERARLLREVGGVLGSHFGGTAENLILGADKSAETLVELVTNLFPGFQDHAIYRGQQVFLYKRAQIFVGDLWGAFQGNGLGEFHDVDRLTMFADYRVPVVLREMGILQYGPELAMKVRQRTEIAPGSEEEVEIRASSIMATERLRDALAEKFAVDVPAIQLDWWLWEQGEKLRKEHPPHHRTRTIFY